MNFSWNNLPRAVAEPLLKGSVGRYQLAALADIALTLTKDAPTPQAGFLLDLASDMFSAAWESDFLDSDMSRQALTMHSLRPFLSKSFDKTANLLSSQSHFPENIDELRACLLSRDAAQTMHYLERKRKSEPANLFWTRQGIMVGMVEGQLDWLERWAQTTDPSLPRPFIESLLGDIAFCRGDYKEACSRYMTALRALPFLAWREKLGECLFQLEQVPEALAQWDIVLARRPWHTNLVLRRDDVRRGRHEADALPPGKGLVLLYTWNKAEELELTLASLAASQLGDTNIIVLDNGSTDSTPEVIRGWQDRLGSRVQGITLPCNIGAPAARNWLLTLPETRACDWLVFLDDDATVPPQWLRHFGKAMAEWPQHHTFGCRVVDYSVPASVQSADLHLDAGGPAGSADGGENGQEPAFVRRFSVSGIHHQVLDFGSFSYARPCVSVTGCCHLFRREALYAPEGGGLSAAFDLRYSPSQYDDLEHDVRQAIAGNLVIYQGHLQVRHMKRTGRAAWADSGHMMSSWANLFKLQTRYTHQQYDAVRELEHQALLADMLERVGGARE